MMIRYFITFTCLVLLVSCGPNIENDKEYNWNFPQGFPKPFVPVDNPMSAEKVELGRFLFYDTQLSANGSQSCASCHLQNRAFSEPLTTSVGSTGQMHRRNAQALVNVAFNHSLTWANDEIVTLERQILLPLFGEQPIEMGVGGHEDEIIERLSNAQYKALFLKAFDDDEINFDRIVKALASFTRSLVSLDSPFDQYAYQMKDDALSESQLRGMNMFFSEKLECHHCHGGFNFTQSTTHEKQQLDLRAFHNTGLYNLAGEYSYPRLDTGLFEATAKLQDVGRFRTPTLRNVELTAPYMHDGSINTLSEVVDFYAAGGRHIDGGELAGDGRKNPFKSQFVKGFELDAQQKADLVAFLEALTDSKFISNPKHANPFLEKR